MARKMRRASAAKVNEDGRAMVSAACEALVDLREAAATFLRYMGSVDDCFEREDYEVAKNVLDHQRRNLRLAVEETGPLTPDGYAGRGVVINPTKVNAETEPVAAGGEPAPEGDVEAISDLYECVERLSGYRCNGQESFLAHVDVALRKIAALSRSGGSGDGITPEEARAASNWLDNIEEFEDCGCVECSALAKLRALAGSGGGNEPMAEGYRESAEEDRRLAEQDMAAGAETLDGAAGRPMNHPRRSAQRTVSGTTLLDPREVEKAESDFREDLLRDRAKRLEAELARERERTAKLEKLVAEGVPLFDATTETHGSYEDWSEAVAAWQDAAREALAVQGGEDADRS